jgi:hypothetical protein
VASVLYLKRVIGTVDQYPDVDAVRTAIAGLIAEVNCRIGSHVISTSFGRYRAISIRLKLNLGSPISSSEHALGPELDGRQDVPHPHLLGHEI